MNNHKDIEALRTLLEYVGATTNLDDPMLGEIKSAHQTLTDYINQFNA